jgi:hypothetical protein
MTANAASITVSIRTEETERDEETEKYRERYRELCRQAHFIVRKYPAKSGEKS